jgi:hypothetical protein
MELNLEVYLTSGEVVPVRGQVPGNTPGDEIRGVGIEGVSGVFVDVKRGYVCAYKKSEVTEDED